MESSGLLGSSLMLPVVPRSSQVAAAAAAGATAIAAAIAAASAQWRENRKGLFFMILLRV